MDYFKFSCQECKKHYKLPMNYLGRLIKCPSCKASIQLPEQVNTTQSNPEHLEEETDTSTPARDEKKSCPFCGEEILSIARKCKHCGEYIDPELRASKIASTFSYTFEQILIIAKAQRGIILCVLFNIIYFVVLGIWWNKLPIYISWIVWIIVPFMMYFVYRLTSVLEAGTPLLWALAMFIPFISIILLLVLSQMATTALKKSGFKVGLMGAKISEIKARQN